MTQQQYEEYFLGFAKKIIEELVKEKFSTDEFNFIGKVEDGRNFHSFPCYHGSNYLHVDVLVDPSPFAPTTSIVELKKGTEYVIPDEIIHAEHLMSLFEGVCPGCNKVHAAYSVRTLIGGK